MKASWIHVNHVFSCSMDPRGHKKVVYIFYLHPNNVLLSWQYMTMCSNILFLPEFLSTSFLQICKPDLHQIWSRGVLCALEDPIQFSPGSTHRWRYSNKFKKQIHDYSQAFCLISSFWICCYSATYGPIVVNFVWGLLEHTIHLWTKFGVNLALQKSLQNIH